MRNRIPMLSILMLACVMALPSQSALATLITIGATTEFSGGSPPAATPSPPWLTAQFDDHNTPGSVTLNLTASNLTGGEFVGGWYLNLDTALDPDDLIFSTPTKIGSFITPTISTEIDGCKADGDGYYDILIAFSESGGLADRFTAGDSISYTITGIAGLTADSFNFLSKPGGGKGIYAMAGHVQNTPGGGSGWVTGPAMITTVPEPSALVMLGLGLAAIAVCFRRRFT
jgi:hypothetical protein